MKYLGVGGERGGGPVLKHLCNVHHLILQDFFIFRFSYVNYINET